MSRYAEINLDKKLSEKDREYLLGRSRNDLVEDNDRKFPKKGDGEEAYQLPYTVAAPQVEPDAVEFHTPQPVPPRPGDRIDGAAEARGADPLVVAEEEATVDELNVDELQAELRARNLPVSGNKKELQKRLDDALKKEE